MNHTLPAVGNRCPVKLICIPLIALWLCQGVDLNQCNYRSVITCNYSSSSCVVIVVLSGLDAHRHAQARVTHFNCGGLGHKSLCTIPSNGDLNKCNISMFFASTHLPDLKGFLSESKMVYVLLHLVNHAKLFFTKNDLLFQIALFRTRDQHHASNKQAGFPWEEFGVFEMVGGWLYSPRKKYGTSLRSCSRKI